MSLLLFTHFTRNEHPTSIGVGPLEFLGQSVRSRIYILRERQRGPERRCAGREAGNVDGSSPPRKNRDGQLVGPFSISATLLHVVVCSVWRNGSVGRLGCYSAVEWIGKAWENGCVEICGMVT